LESPAFRTFAAARQQVRGVIGVAARLAQQAALRGAGDRG
jgi:hypothetical protein